MISETAPNSAFLGGRLFTFIHAADIHLDSPLRGLEYHEDAPLDQIRGAARRALENLVNLAIEEQAVFVLIAGDLYDGDWRDFNTGLFFNRMMNRLKEARIRVFVVCGNHDAASSITKNLRPPDNVTFFSSRKPETVTISEINVAIHGQSFANRAIQENLSSAYPQAIPGYLNIGLLHTSLTGREGHEPYAPSTVDGLKSKGYDYWALGHIHMREVVAEEPWIIFPGNIQGRHIREKGAKGCTLVNVDEGRIIRVEHRDLDVLRWRICQADLSACRTIDNIYEQVQAALEKIMKECDGLPVMVRLELVGTTPMHQQLQKEADWWENAFRGIAANLGGADIWIEKIRVKTKEKMDLEALMSDDNPIGGMLKMLVGLEVSSDNISELDPEMGAFLAKLPAEIRGGEEPFDPTQPEQWGEICSDVKEILIARLLHAGGGR
jgi:DNA repair exonuclease SbcCD nuclease subunit